MASPLHQTQQLVWFRRDLRLGANPAWAAATQQADEVTALFVLDHNLYDRAGSFRQAALGAHLRALDDQLRLRGGRLRVEHGDPVVQVARVANEIGAERVHWNADVTPYANHRDRLVHRALDRPAATHWGTLVHEPGRVRTRKGSLSKVFTPFYNVWNATSMAPWPQQEGTAMIPTETGSGLPDLAGVAAIPGGEDAARKRLGDFLNRVDDYVDTRDLPATDGTSLLSGDLRFGTLSPREVVEAAGETSNGRQAFVRQLAWRDWYAHLLQENPTMPNAAIRPAYDRVDWLNDAADFQAWKTGMTGYPIVDAGMRQLAATGYMHNRVRMITGSFLVKDLLIDWRKGERWFRHLLVDADMSQNVGNWQWVAGCGTDAAPYFRVFNPWTQSRKFDADGDYIRRWVPELAGLDKKAIHEPAAAAPLDLAAAGVVLGDNYPHPIIDHGFARERVLTAYKTALGRS